MEGMEIDEHPETHATNRRSAIMDFICMHYTFYGNFCSIIQVDPRWSQVYGREKYQSRKPSTKGPLGNFAAMLDRIATRMT
jgi:hypothetical protein